MAFTIQVKIFRPDGAAFKRARMMVGIWERNLHRWWYHGFCLRAFHLACSRHGRN